MKNEDKFKAYEDMLHLDHYKSRKRAKMKIKDRAAQFAPFAAVVGHEAAVKEAARLTVRKKVLTESEILVINETLREISESYIENPLVRLVYFEKDQNKEGGRYATLTTHVIKIDVYHGTLLLEGDKTLSIQDIYSISIE